ncbi:hypothetical protein G6F59_015914 [Rhizopus arrhizus]|nr:hypothetical protein G6F59_015914 [Rhizopus arrhizus]
MSAFSSVVRSSARIGLASFSWAMPCSRTATMRCDSLSPERAVFWGRCRAFSAVCMSASASSVSMTSMSAIGSTLPATWITLGSSKQRTTLTMASVSRMCDRNWLPRPSPLLAPATRPAMPTNSTVADRMRSGLTISASFCRRGSGTSTKPTLGSMVQNG